MNIDLIKIRREFHKIPETGFKEHKTSTLIKSILDKYEIKYNTIIGTGILVQFGEGHPHIAFRAEIDGLPIKEMNDFEYKSCHDGYMHACGHDCHIAALIGTILSVKELFDKNIIKKGAVSFVFQPCEETKNSDGVSGGQLISELPEMLDIDYFYAAHVESTLEFGKVFIREGALTAAIDKFEITVLGNAGHGAYPHNAVDPIWLACNAVQMINTLESRVVNTAYPSVISVCSFNSGGVWNVIPDDATLNGTIRTFNQSEREKIHLKIDACLQSVKNFGGDYCLNIEKGNPSVVNSVGECNIVKSAVTNALGEEFISDIEIQMGGDDFSYYSSKKPSCYFYVGAKKDGVSRQHHSGNFDINEQAINEIERIFVEIVKLKLKTK